MTALQDHGTAASYWRGCRCDACRDAVRVYNNELNHRSGRHVPWDEHVARVPRGRSHGRIATYNQGCRCDDCRGAARDAKARWRAGRRKAAS